MSCFTCNLLCRKPSENWWLPGQIKFCDLQVMFLLANLGALKAYEWPEKKTGYIDTHEDVQVTASESTMKQDIIIVYSTLARRIKKLPPKYQDLIEDVDWEKLYWLLTPAARDIVKYLKNPEKEQNFNDWLKQRKYRGKIGAR